MDAVYQEISFSDQHDYMPMSLYNQHCQGQKRQFCSEDTKEAVDTCNDEVKGSADHYGQKNELIKMKRCLCMLSFLVAILFLLTVSSLGLAAYGFASIVTPSSQIQEASLEDTTEFSNHKNLVNMIESHINATSGDIASLETLRFIANNLESQLNTINSTLRSSVISLESQLRMTNMTISSLQFTIRSQPGMQYILEHQFRYWVVYYLKAGDQS